LHRRRSQNCKTLATFSTPSMGPSILDRTSIYRINLLLEYWNLEHVVTNQRAGGEMDQPPASFVGNLAFLVSRLAHQCNGPGDKAPRCPNR
jgi:hypothetical protein